MSEEFLYEFRHMSDDIDVTPEIICGAIKKIEYGRAWGCLAEDGTSILIQKGRIIELEKIKFLKCNAKEAIDFRLLSNNNELISLLKEEVFKDGNINFDHYEFVGVLDIMEQFEKLAEKLVVAKAEGLWQVRVVEE